MPSVFINDDSCLKYMIDSVITTSRFETFATEYVTGYLGGSIRERSQQRALVCAQGDTNNDNAKGGGRGGKS